MDNSLVMDVRQEANSFGDGGEMSPGTQQDSYAVLEKDSLTGFFQDAEFLEYSPFDEDDSEGGFQKAAPTEMNPDRLEDRLPVLPVKPVMVQEQISGQLSEYSAEAGCGNLDESTQEEPDADEISEEEALQEDKSVENSAEKEAEEERKRAEHEASEAKRKAEWEARQQAKREEEKANLERIMAMGSEELMAESMKRVMTDTEKLTRRNMKECVAEYIQTMCLENEAFARQVMLPRKNMVRCFQYINRKAYEYVQDEMKAAGVQPGRDTPCYSSDIPDDVCYHWAEEYFRTMDVKEDKEEEEKFVPKPYAGTTTTGAKGKKGSTKKSAAKKPAGKKPAEKKAAEKKPSGQEPDNGSTAGDGQLSFAGQISFEDFMGRAG